MADPMTLEQFEDYLGEMKQVNRFGWVPEFNKIGKMVRNSHKDRFRRHVDPSGKAWAKTFAKPKPKVGDEVPAILDDKGGRKKIRAIKISSVDGKQRAVKFRQKFGPPFKPQPALIRTREAPGTYKTVGRPSFIGIRDWLIGSGFRSRGAMRVTKTSFFFGFTAGSAWIEKMQFGTSFMGATVPKREVVGWTEILLKSAENIVADGLDKRAQIGPRKAAAA